MSDPTTAPPAPKPKPFDEFLTEYRRGSLRDELSAALHEVLAEVMSIEKAGSLTLKVNVVPVGDMQVAISCEVATKLPKPGAPAAHFYVDFDGNPSRSDPYRPQLPVDRSAAEPQLPSTTPDQEV